MASSIASIAHSRPKYIPKKQNNVANGHLWTVLDMANMGIHNVSLSIRVYPHLTGLFLHNNHLTTLKGEIFTVLPALTTLDLSFNRITSLPPEIGKLSALQELYLADNLLMELPVEIGRISQLKRLDVDGNPITNPPQDIISQPAPTIVSYLRDRMPPGPPPPERTWINLKNDNTNTTTNEKFIVLCYNVLAEDYATQSRYHYCPMWALDWSYRQVRILKEMLAHEADILSLQEVQFDQYRSYFEPAMNQAGYTGVYEAKSRAKHMEESVATRVDGCAIFFKNSRFALVEKHIVEYQAKAMEKTISQEAFTRLHSKDNIAIFLLLELLDQNGKHRTKKQILVSNTHIHWDPEFADVKLVQTQMLLEELFNNWANLPMIITGDFNSTPDSGPYSLLSTGYVAADHPDLAGYDYGTYSVGGLNSSLKLESIFNQVGEPSFTNYTEDFVGTLDYIFVSKEKLNTVKVLQPVDEEVVKQTYLPNAYMSSDHIPLAVEVEIL